MQICRHIGFTIEYRKNTGNLQNLEADMEYQYDMSTDYVVQKCDIEQMLCSRSGISIVYSVPGICAFSKSSIPQHSLLAYVSFLKRIFNIFFCRFKCFAYFLCIKPARITGISDTKTIIFLIRSNSKYEKTDLHGIS